MNSTSSSFDYKTGELTGLPNSLFKKNRENFLQNLFANHKSLEQNSILVLEGGANIPRYDTDVNTFLFIQDSHFYYLTGVREADFYAIIDLAKRELHLFFKLPPISTKVWQRVPSLEELTKKYETPVYDYVDFYDKLAGFGPKKIYVLNGTNTDSGSKVKTATLQFPEKYKNLESLVDADPLVWEYLADSKTRKSDEEIEAMKQAVKITVESHIDLMKNMKRYRNERDLEANFLGYCAEHYYTREMSYPCICGSSTDSSTLHYVKNDKPLNKDSLVLIDMGSRYVGYSADITMTIPISGKYTKKQKEIYNIVLLANRTVMALLKAGVSWVDMHLAAEKVILNGLIDLGLVNKFPVQELLDNRVAYYFMPHGLGHLLGTDVHDVGGYLSFTPERRKEPGLKSLRTARVVEENQILTVEPGIYFIPFLLEKAFANEKIAKYFIKENLVTYYDFGGVRIEDDVLVRKDDCLNLSDDLPRTTEEIEDLMK